MTDEQASSLAAFERQFGSSVADIDVAVEVAAAVKQWGEWGGDEVQELLDGAIHVQAETEQGMICWLILVDGRAIQALGIKGTGGMQ